MRPSLAIFVLSCCSFFSAANAGKINSISVGDYPNPRIQFAECNMRSYAKVCDPDQIVTEGERYRLNTGITSMQTRSEGRSGDFCAKKGLEAVLAIIDSGDQQYADGLFQKWASYDSQCKKEIVILLSKNTHSIFIAGASEAQLDIAQVAGMLADQEHELRDGKYVHALENIFHRLSRLARPPETNQVPTGRPPSEQKTDSGAGSIVMYSVLYALTAMVLS